MEWVFQIAKGARFKWLVDLPRAPKVGEEYRIDGGRIAVVIKSITAEPVLPSDEEDAPPPSRGIARVAWPAWRVDAEELVRAARMVCEDEKRKTGIWPTLRRVHYKLFQPHGKCRNENRDYKRLSRVLKEARLAGTFPMFHIRDAEREMRSGSYRNRSLDPEVALESAVRWAVDAPNDMATGRWYGQPIHVAVLYEKKAAMDTFRGPCQDNGIPDLYLKGYSSLSAVAAYVGLVKRVMDHADTVSNDLDELIESLENEIEYTDDEEEIAELQTQLERAKNDPGIDWTIDDLVILYFGDHDPEGEDIPRVFQERVSEAAEAMGLDLPPLEFRRCALNPDQIEALDLPPEPAKPMSSRLEKYEAKHGHADVWELDAADVVYLREIMLRHLEGLFDSDIRVRADETEERWKVEARKQMGEPDFLDRIKRALAEAVAE